MRTSLRLAGASLFACGLVCPGQAADLRAPAPAYKAPMPMVAAIADWSGLYLGINGGGGESRLQDSGLGGASGGTVGGQVGYRWQATNWVFGLEAQGNWAGFKRTLELAVPPVSASVRTNAFGLFTGQVGYAWNKVLLYVKGGGAVVSNRAEVDVIGVGSVSKSETRWGGTVGVGLDFAFAPSWSLGLEYDHLFPGKRDDMRQDVDVGLARLNYRFGGPLVARYGLPGRFRL
ncbi:MAG: outer membrane beta-barrel protein [Alphaproteobacteria bacterium]|nr:outer membrane beta-barrel protein [Alphaproteobacteria bacterium]